MTVQVSPVAAPSLGEAVLERSALAGKVRTYASLTELPPSYQRLFEIAGAKSFFHSLPWYQNLVSEALGTNEQIRILGLELEDGDATPVAALPLRVSADRRFGWKIRALSSLSNYYTTVYEPLLDPSYPVAQSLQALAGALAAERPRADVINLKPLERPSPAFEGLVAALRQSGFVVQTYFCHGNWFYPVRGRSYKEYLESLRSSVRNIARSKNKKLERTGRARIEVTIGRDGLDAAIRAYEKVYAASWKVAEPFPQFVPGLIRTCAEMGWLRLGVAYIDDEPAAAQIWIIHNGTASIYKIAYDQKFKDLSVGSFLMMHLMERAIDVDKVREVDYLSGDDRYKSDWMSDRREQWGILAMNPRSVAGAAAIARHIGGRAVKTAARNIIAKLSRRTAAATTKTAGPAPEAAARPPAEAEKSLVRPEQKNS